MKKLALLLTLAVVFASCEGPQGPPGFDGFNGRNGLDARIAQSFEVEIDFNTANGYASLVTYPFSVGIDDMTLVYVLWDVVPANGGGTVDVWRLLPQTVYTDFGEFQYNFDATQGDVDIFLDAPSSFNFNNLAPGDLNDQFFRIVVLPVTFSDNPLLDITDYQSVMNLAGLNTTDIITIEN